MEFNRNINLNEIPVLEVDKDGNPFPPNTPLMSRIDWDEFKKVRRQWERDYERWIREIKRRRR